MPLANSSLKHHKKVYFKYSIFRKRFITDFDMPSTYNKELKVSYLEDI